MSIFKKFSKSDISIVPFTAHKQTTLIGSSSLKNIGGNYYTADYPIGNKSKWRKGSSTFNFQWAKSGSYELAPGFPVPNDPDNCKKYFQLDHLFYKNSKTDYVNKFSTIEYFDHYRVLHSKVNILSLPYKTIGSKIHSGSFLFTTESITLRDDGKGHIYDTKFGLGDLNFTP